MIARCTFPMTDCAFDNTISRRWAIIMCFEKKNVDDCHFLFPFHFLKQRLNNNRKGDDQLNVNHTRWIEWEIPWKLKFLSALSLALIRMFFTFPRGSQLFGYLLSTTVYYRINLLFNPINVRFNHMTERNASIVSREIFFSTLNSNWLPTTETNIAFVHPKLQFLDTSVFVYRNLFVCAQNQTTKNQRMD